MSRKYTAQEMRELAEMIDHGGAFALTDPSTVKANVAMLRQAADMMGREEAREKKYEYAEKYADGEVSCYHTTELRCDDVLFPDDSTVVRRAVGEWEDYKDA